MRGFAVVIRRDDGSHFFATPNQGFAAPVFFTHAEALAAARGCREHRLDAQVVKVEYSDPVVLGPKRFLEQP